jgi:glycolate oxidase FAD binding subunit
VSATGISLDVVRELRGICGEEHVGDESSVLKERPDDPAFRLARQHLQTYVTVAPGSAEEISAVLRLANQRGFSARPAGGRTKQTPQWGGPVVVVNTNRLTAVEHYDPADLTVGVGAGMTVAHLNAMVGQDKLMFGGDPPFADLGTVGGLLATASHGPLRHGYGAVRDYCIGIRFVTGDGRCAKGGGRVVKNVAGYDLMKLLIGSHGTLAVITSASFKLFPAPRQTRTFVCEFATWQEALKFRDAMRHSALAPMCLELVSPAARRLIRRETNSGTWAICLRASGSDAVLARYRKELGLVVTREVEREKERDLWQGIENCCERERMHVRMDVIVPPSSVAYVLQALDDVTDQRFGYAAVGRIGLGHLRVFTPKGAVGGTQPANVFIGKLREQVTTEIGVTVESWVTPWPIAPPHLASMRAVKQALDPNNILRGREIS